MRIAIDLRSLMETGGQISGIENYTVNVVNSLAQQNIDLFGFYNSYKKVLLPGLSDNLLIKKTHIPNKILNTSLKFFNFPKFERLYGDFDILWMPDIRPFAISNKTKLVLTVHDLSALMHSEHYSLKRRLWHSFVDYKSALRRADKVLADSEYTRSDLEKIFAVDPRKIEVVHLGVDHRRFNRQISAAAMAALRQKYLLPEHYILCLSTVEPRKNILSLLLAFEQISDPKLHLVIAGRPGWLYKKVLKRLRDSQKKDKIKYLGYIPENEKPPLIAASTMVCYPSYYEGFGLVPLEAMACGIPLITSARTSLPEVCKDAALLIEPYQTNDLINAINILSSDAAFKSRLTDKALEAAQRFSWVKCAEAVQKVFQKA